MATPSPRSELTIWLPGLAGIGLSPRGDGTSDSPHSNIAADYTLLPYAEFRQLFDAAPEPLALLHEHMAEICHRYNLTHKMIEVVTSPNSESMQDFSDSVTNFYRADVHAPRRRGQKLALLGTLSLPRTAKVSAVMQVDREFVQERNFRDFYQSNNSTALVRYDESTISTIEEGERQQYGRGKQKFDLTHADFVEIEIGKLQQVLVDFDTGKVRRRKQEIRLGEGVIHAHNAYKRLQALEDAIGRNRSMLQPITQLRANLREYGRILLGQISTVHDLSPTLTRIIQTFNADDTASPDISEPKELEAFLAIEARIIEIE